MLSQLVLPIHVPRAHRDPITSATQALAVFSLAISRPLLPETLVLMLSRNHFGIGLIAFDGDDALPTVIDNIVGRCAAHDSVRSVAIATVRPHRVPHDNTREWGTSHSICQRAGLQLIDWFVVEHFGVYCPRAQRGERSVWTN